jgi:putative transposase
VVRQLPSALMTLAHQGSKAYHQRFDLLHRREAEAPNAIWQADHCWLDSRWREIRSLRIFRG